jgi:hypothetical protein
VSNISFKVTSNLPPQSRKAAVVAAVHSGEITLEAACGRYELSIEEFRAWESKAAPRSAFSALAIDLLNSGRP